MKHKILDAIGDLYLLGHSLIGEFSGYKSGHGLNNNLLRTLIAEPRPRGRSRGVREAVGRAHLLRPAAAGGCRLGDPGETSAILYDFRAASPCRFCSPFSDAVPEFDAPHAFQIQIKATSPIDRGGGLSAWKRAAATNSIDEPCWQGGVPARRRGRVDAFFARRGRKRGHVRHRRPGTFVGTVRAARTGQRDHGAGDGHRRGHWPRAYRRSSAACSAEWGSRYAYRHCQRARSHPAAGVEPLRHGFSRDARRNGD